MALDLGALAWETCIVDVDSIASLADESFDSVVVQAPAELDPLLELAQARVSDGGAILVDARCGGLVRSGGWRASDVVDGVGMSLVRVQPVPSEDSEGLNLLLRATSRAWSDRDTAREASLEIRRRALAAQADPVEAEPRSPLTSAAVSPGSPPRPAAAPAPATRSTPPPAVRPRPTPPPAVRPRPTRPAGWRQALPEALRTNGAGFGRRLVLVAAICLAWTMLGVLVATLTSTGWLAVALWVIAGLQLGQLGHLEITRRSLKLLVLRTRMRG